MPKPVSLQFSSPPAVWAAYPKVLLARRPALVPQGREIPLIEARLDDFAVRASHLESYRRLCGTGAEGNLPLAYPHVLAMPLHVSMLSSDAFPVRLLGLVHVRNTITARRAIGESETLSFACRLQGHRETDRGQEFDLETECRTGAEVVWTEISTFLARRRSGGEKSKAGAKPPADETPSAVRTTSWHCDADIGRRYAWISGDFNPIHLADVSARLFGFQSAIAHGMWSLARTAAELQPRLQADAVTLSASFKLPILLPAWVNLQSWEAPGSVAFSLKDAAGEKPHVTGTLSRA